MKKTVGYIFEYIWMFILLGFLWPKGDVKNREEDLARIYKAKDQIEINKQKQNPIINPATNITNRTQSKNFMMNVSLNNTYIQS